MAPSERSPEVHIVSSALLHRADRNPDAPCLRTRESVIGYGEVAEQSHALAAALANLGVNTGDRIALLLPVGPEFAITAFAASHLGATLVPLHPRTPPADLRYMLRHSGAICAVTVEDAFGKDYLQLFEDLLEDLPELEIVVTVGREDLWYDDQIFQWEDLISAGSGRPVPASGDDATAAFAIAYTAGTTGKPKGVALSHRNLLHAAAATNTAVGLTSADVVVGVTALWHVFGLGPGLLGSVLGGASLVLADIPDAALVLDLAERHRATLHYGGPTLFARELREVRRRGSAPDTLRLCVAAGAPLNESLARRIEETFGAPVLRAYALTETASTLAMACPGDPPEARILGVGRPVAGTAVRITDDDGVALEPGRTGEIRVRGPGVMLGYYRQPRQTRAVLDRDGFLRTGDLGALDENGFLYLRGRRSDVIIRDGVKVQPREVEGRLELHPAVDQCALVGIPDDILGEALCACVVRVEGGVVTEREIRLWCATALPDYKVPDLVIFMNSLPRTRAGKIRRRELARRVAMRKKQDRKTR